MLSSWRIDSTNIDASKESGNGSFLIRSSFGLVMTDRVTLLGGIGRSYLNDVDIRDSHGDTVSKAEIHRIVSSFRLGVRVYLRIGKGGH